MSANCEPPGVEDMIELGDLHEGALLQNLRLRYSDLNIYTYTGDILTAVNPYKSLGYITEENKALYKGKPLHSLPPHPFAIADTCYSRMMAAIRDGVQPGHHKDQSIVISGESGAGKTVTTGHMLQYLTSVAAGETSKVGQQIVDSGEMLESFGNAKTSRNNNRYRGVVVRSGVLRWVPQKGGEGGGTRVSCCRPATHSRHCTLNVCRFRTLFVPLPVRGLASLWSSSLTAKGRSLAPTSLPIYWKSRG